MDTIPLVPCEWTPEDQDACRICANEFCNKCGAGYSGFTGRCEHGSLERHEYPEKDTTP